MIVIIIYNGRNGGNKLVVPGFSVVQELRRGQKFKEKTDTLNVERIRNYGASS